MSSGIEYYEDRFRRVYLEHFEPLLAYALRRVAHPEDAADVVAETFLVAWRRRHDIPADDEARLWLYGVARRVLANHHRGGFAASGWVNGCVSRSPSRSPPIRQ